MKWVRNSNYDLINLQNVGLIKFDFEIVGGRPVKMMKFYNYEDCLIKEMVVKNCYSNDELVQKTIDEYLDDDLSNWGFGDEES